MLRRKRNSWRYMKATNKLCAEFAILDSKGNHINCLCRTRLEMIKQVL